VPSKMYGILAAGKPIVAVAPVECDVVSLGKEKGFGISVDPKDAGEFARRVRELAQDAERLREMGAAAAAAAPEYERARELEKLVAVVEEARR
jgi:colanic acid biosynthesis glycosyl transferase WcaI